MSKTPGYKSGMVDGMLVGMAFDLLRNAGA
jgi:hypothetical protein